MINCSAYWQGATEEAIRIFYAAAQKALEQPKKGAKSTTANATDGERSNSGTALV